MSILKQSLVIALASCSVLSILAAQAAPVRNNKLIEVSKSSGSKSTAVKPAAKSASTGGSVLTLEERNLQPGLTTSAKTTIDEPKLSAQPNSAFQTDAAGNTSVVNAGNASGPLTGSGANAGLNTFAGAGTKGNTNGLNNANDHLINENNRNNNRVIPTNSSSPFRQAGR